MLLCEIPLNRLGMGYAPGWGAICAGSVAWPRLLRIYNRTGTLVDSDPWAFGPLWATRSAGVHRPVKSVPQCCLIATRTGDGAAAQAQ